jgi:hypothetical protein
MASWFGSFAGGFAKGLSEQITKKEEEQSIAAAASVTNMYHNVQEKKKEINKQKEEYRATVSELGSFVFKDGNKFNDQQLITLASNPEMAKDIVKRLRDDPELSSRITTSFFKAAASAPADVKASDYMDELFKVRVAATDKTKELFNTAAKGGGLVDQLVAGNGYTQAQKAAAKYGMSLEQLIGYQEFTTKRPPNMMGEMDYSQLAKSKTFDQIESDALIKSLNAKTPKDQQDAANDLVKIKVAKASIAIGGKETEEDKRSKMADEAQDPKKTVGERAIAATLLQQRIKLMANPKEVSEEKITQSNLITVASRGFASTLESLVPGKFVTSTDMQGNITVTPKTIADTQMKTAYAQSRNAMINEFTGTDGKPKSVTSRNALVSIGVTFDQDGRAVKATPETVLMNVLPTPVAGNAPPVAPVAPAASTRGGPMQPKPAAPPAPAAMPAPKTQAEYDAIPKGTRYMDTDGKEKVKT